MENYPPNTNLSKVGDVDKPGPEKSEPVEVKRVVSGKVTRGKKPLGQRFKDLFFGGSIETVWTSLRDEVLIPAAKDTITSFVSQGIERAVYGDRGGAPRRPGRTAAQNGYVNYQRYSSIRRDEPRPTAQRTSVPKHEGPFVLESRVEAEDVIDQIQQLVSEYGHASLAALYSSLGITPTFTDENWGWFDIRGFHVNRVSGGYLLSYPNPEPLTQR